MSPLDFIVRLEPFQVQTGIEFKFGLLYIKDLKVIKENF
jgi:hypothetical protein